MGLADIANARLVMGCRLTQHTRVQSASRYCYSSSHCGVSLSPTLEASKSMTRRAIFTRPYRGGEQGGAAQAHRVLRVYWTHRMGEGERVPPDPAS